MVHAPALEIRVVHQGAWRGGVGLLAALCSATSLLWWAAHAPPWPAWVVAAALAGCALALAVAAACVRAQPEQVLRWDRRQWWLARGAMAAEQGSLGVAIDLGDWMLLRFAPQGRTVWPQARWIPVQRRGLEASWHALRCAVHAPQAHDSAAA